MKEKSSQCTFAVGDVHGRADLLRRLQANIAAEAARRGMVKPKLVYCGDYIDRGIASKEVIDLVLDGLPDFERVPLKGNHEVMMEDALSSPTSHLMSMWLTAGGISAMRSYGVPYFDREEYFRYPEIFWDLFIKGVPDRHHTFLKRLKLHHQDQHAFYVHAGLNPEYPLSEQTEDDLLWIRDPFLNSKKLWKKPVVHGHTPVDYGPDLRPNRIGIDTRAHRSGCLTAVLLGDGPPRFITACEPAEAWVLIGGKGSASPAWIQWNVACALDAGATQMAVCGLTKKQLVEVMKLTAGTGLSVEVMTVPELARSHFLDARNQEKTKVYYSGLKARRTFSTALKSLPKKVRKAIVK